MYCIISIYADISRIYHQCYFLSDKATTVSTCIHTFESLSDIAHVCIKETLYTSIKVNSPLLTFIVVLLPFINHVRPIIYTC